MVPEVQPLRLARQRRRRHEGRLGLGLLPFVEIRKFGKQQIGDDEPQDGVAQELEGLVIQNAAADVFVRS